MPPLSSSLRTILENIIIRARDASEEAAKAALTALEVGREEMLKSASTERRALRVALRARARQLGGAAASKDFDAGVALLIEEVAYQQWHRRLFVRFLAENDLLMHPEHQVAVTLQDCRDLASEEGEVDEWQLAARYASAMLPGIFRSDDPTARVQLSPEGRHELERIVMSLPSPIFTADDTLGWSYQFWQTKKKKAVNLSGKKIGGADLSPVTQLFTEDYMVQFLLENSLGAWWAARYPDSTLVKQFTYLRFTEDGQPAAGTFPGWPDHAAKITIMDPCCGSGHFLVAALDMLRQMRMEEEDLSEVEAAAATVSDNIFGLELDARCTQIAAFALALAAWKIGSYQPLLPNIACSGIAVAGQLETWTALANGDDKLRNALERYHELFCNAPDLGSLINPNDVPLKYRMFYSEYTEVGPLLERALARERKKNDPTSAVFGAAAEGVAQAAKLLAGTYTLVVTNVPYLKRGKQNEILKNFCNEHHSKAKADLATAFLERCQTFANSGGSYALVTPQNWLFLSAYKTLREQLLLEQSWEMVVWLGEGGFDSNAAAGAFTALITLTNNLPSEEYMITGINASSTRVVFEKARLLRELPIKTVKQFDQLYNPDMRIVLENTQLDMLLSSYAHCYQGVKTGDDPRLHRLFWEFPHDTTSWRFFQSTVEKTVLWGGREALLNWKQYGHNLARLQGISAWEKPGVAISQMRNLPATLYSGGAFDSNVGVIIPNDPSHLLAIWAYCRSSEYSQAVRQIDQTLKVTNATLVKVPFDLEYWQSVADAVGPLPEPYSNDPTQWLFDGNPDDTTHPLQVAVARLLGYEWPQQKHDMLHAFADKGNIICLPSVAGEDTAVEQLRTLLATVYGDVWSPALQEHLLSEVGFGGKSLALWLRDGFFAQHCKLFHNRPFIWHIWDGLPDGFSALVNYHQLTTANFDRLIYTYLGAWIARQKAEQEAKVAGAETRFIAANELQKKLKAISEGEAPYDIYVRWKPLHEQPEGWQPDLNDGVRLNIRPFVEAGVLRNRFTIHWKKDRGTNPDGTERTNDHHPTLDEKRAAKRMHTQSTTVKK